MPDPLHVILSGPKRTQGQAVNALTRAGFPALENPHDTTYGLTPERHDGDDPAEDQAFLCVEAGDIDACHATAEPYGWTLRAHRYPPPPSDPSQLETLAATIADMKAEIAALKAAA